MTLDELEEAYRSAYARAAEQRLGYGATCYIKRESQELMANLLADTSFKEQTWWIAKSYGMDAAMLFKLSDGAIDPRSKP